MGKTMSLFRIWQRQLEPHQDKNRLPIYIPLNECNVYAGYGFIKDFVSKKYKIDLDKDIGCWTILLLDGFNEVANDKKVGIVREIKDYMKRAGIQIILTSRYDFSKVHGFNMDVFELQLLTTDAVIDFLSQSQFSNSIADRLLQQQNVSKLLENDYKILRNPMMLMLFSNSLLVRQQIEEHFVNFKDAIPDIQDKTVAEILKTYLLCQIGQIALNTAKARDNTDVIKTAFALRYISPYIAYKLEEKSSFNTTKREMRALVTEYLDLYGESDFNEVQNWIRDVFFLPTFPLRSTYSKDSDEYIELLISRHVFISEEKDRYILRHQHFRDFYATAFIAKVLEDWGNQNNSSIPSIISAKLYQVHITKMLGNYLCENENSDRLVKETILHKIVNTLRNKSHNDFGFALQNIINIWKSSRNGQVIGEDLSRLDLSKVSLNGIFFSNSFVQTRFNNSIFTEESLLPSAHNGAILSVAFAPESLRNSYFITSSSDHTAIIWDYRSGELIHRLSEHSDKVNSAQFSPNGEYIVTASDDCKAIVWDAKTYSIVAILHHPSNVNKAEFCPFSDFIVTASDDCVATIWNVHMFEKVGVLSKHEKRVNSAIFSPDGKHIVTVSDDRTAIVWDSGKQSDIAILKGHEKRVSNVSYNNTGKFIVTTSDDLSAIIWDAESYTRYNTLSDQFFQFTDAKYSPDGNWIATSAFNNSVYVWNAETGVIVHRFPWHKRTVHSIAYSPCGGLIASSSNDNTVHICSAESGDIIRVFGGQNAPLNSIAFSPKGDYFATASDDKSVKVWNRATRKIEKVFVGHRDRVFNVAYNYDGTLIVTCSNDCTAKIWDASNGKLIKTLDGHTDRIYDAIFSRDGKLVATASFDKTLRLWAWEEDSEPRIFPEHDFHVSSVAFSHDDRHVASSSWDNTVRIWDCDDVTNYLDKLNYGVPVISIDYSSNGKYLVMSFSAKEKNVLIWNISEKKGSFLGEKEGHSQIVYRVVFSPDNNYVASVSSDTDARIWNLSNDTSILLKGHTAPVYGVAFSPNTDDMQIATCSQNCMIYFWDYNGVRIKNLDMRYYSGLNIHGCSFEGSKFASDELKEIIQQYGGEI